MSRIHCHSGNKNVGPYICISFVWFKWSSALLVSTIIAGYSLNHARQPGDQLQLRYKISASVISSVIMKSWGILGRTWWRHHMQQLSVTSELLRRIHRSTVDYPPNGSVVRSLSIFFVDTINNVLNKQSHKHGISWDYEPFWVANITLGLTVLGMCLLLITGFFSGGVRAICRAGFISK